MHTQMQFSIFLINKPGVLAGVTDALAQAGVNIIALALMDSGEHGALRIVTDNDAKTRQVLQETHDRWTESEVLVLELDNRPGAFSLVAKTLAQAGVNITYAYITGSTSGTRAAAIFKIADLDKAQKVLRQAGLAG